MKRIICFGEIMLRLAPEGYGRFLQAEKYGAVFGGGEANVAVSLANFGMDAAYVTRLPAHDIGQAAVNSLRRYGVDTSGIVRGGDRVGIYYLEKGASMRQSKVIYDRAYSAIATAKREDFDWDKILEGADRFHFTGITPALGDNVAEICLDALKACRKKGVKVSCDLNYRKNLWTTQKAGSVMSELVKYVDLLIANEEHIKMLFGITTAHTGGEYGHLDSEGYKEISQKTADAFGCEKVAVTVRSTIDSNENRFSAVLYDGEQCYFSKEHQLKIVDRVGGGDAFAGGLIYSVLAGFDSQRSIDFAAAAGALKHTVEGDFNLVNVAEVEALLTGSSYGIQR